MRKRFTAETVSLAIAGAETVIRSAGIVLFCIGLAMTSSGKRSSLSRYGSHDRLALQNASDNVVGLRMYSAQALHGRGVTSLMDALQNRKSLATLRWAPCCGRQTSRVETQFLAS